MSKSLAMVDPDWAWSPFTPDANRPWTRRLAAHLHRRAGLGAGDRRIDESLAQSPVAAVHGLVTAQESDAFRREMDDLARSAIATNDVQNLAPWWTYRLLTTPTPLIEKATLFWHGHFATSAAKVTDPELMSRQNELLRRDALGDFGRLVQQISRDPAMLLWLDSATNRKAHPNENYAREVMELFCLGEGEYTEGDIRELARCFTGWEIKAKEFRFNRFQHDGGEKSIFGRSGRFGGEEGVAIVLDQPACPRFLVRKLFRFYLCDEPEAPHQLIEPLAAQLRADGLRIGPTLERMLASNLFFSEYAVGRKVRSPVDLGVGLLRALEGTTNTYDLSRGLKEIGQHLFYPPNVKVWDGGRTWINSSTLLGRANLVRGLLDHDKTRFASGTLSALVESRHLRNGREIVDWLDELLLATPSPADVRSALARRIDEAKGDREQTLRNVLHLLATQPEFQLA